MLISRQYLRENIGKDKWPAFRKGLVLELGKNDRHFLQFVYNSTKKQRGTSPQDENILSN